MERRPQATSGGGGVEGPALGDALAAIASFERSGKPGGVRRFG
jgi:hypothetical protein